MTQSKTNTPPRITPVERHAVRCNLCGSTQTRPFCPQNGRGLVECTTCELVFVGQQPDAHELYALYGETYFKNEESGEVGYTDYRADEANIRKTAQRRLAFVERFAPKRGKLLDVGCALGFIMDEAHRRGWQVEGLDVSHYAVEFVKAQLGHVAHRGALDEVSLPEGAYDAVTMYDVIEHVPDPKENMRRVASLLKSGGIYELATPDVGSLPARLTGKRWIGYKLADEHVYYFSVKTLTRMLNETGFDVLHVRHIGKYVTLRLFLDRLGFYVPFIAKPLQWLEKTFQLSQRSFYVNPFDIVAITAKKR